MVEFVRDVIIAVAVLAALIAVAAQPGPDAGSARDGKSSATAGGTRLAAASSSTAAAADEARGARSSSP